MKAKFVCEGCNKLVAYNAEVCKYCGKKFIAVRCPKCGLIDNPEIFLSRCPSCGYESTIKIGRIKRKSYNKKKNKKRYIPLWIYKASGVLIFLLIVILVFLYLNSLLNK